MFELELELMGGGNRIPFGKLTGNNFGRIVLKTSRDSINRSNIVEDLAEQYAKHQTNATAIAYLDRYYRGDQPILYRVKEIRPDVNNRIVENHAYEIVESKVADLFGEPVQYALKTLTNENEEEKSLKLRLLNSYMDSEGKADLDIERGRWASICGTSYFYIGGENRAEKDFDEAPFWIKCENPIYTFVVYYADDNTPAYGVRILEDEEGQFFKVYTNNEWFTIRDSEVVDSGINVLGMVNIIEYPNNHRRISDIEITIGLTDELNKMQSDRMNGIEQFIQSFILFVNAEIDKETFLDMISAGALAINDAEDNRQASARVLESQLDQTGAQISKDDIYKNLLIIQGKPGRDESTGGDTGQAVALRNGYYEEDKRAELRIPTFIRSEKQMLKVVLRYCRLKETFDLRLSEIDIKPKRSKLENMMVKAQVLQILHQLGVDDEVAMKLVNLFSDVQDAYAKSKDTMKAQFESTLTGTQAPSVGTGESL